MSHPQAKLKNTFACGIDSLDNYVNQENYGLTAYNLKEIDKYLWQLGKSYYKKYN